eukprot:952856-Amphidinium_carterae.1
MDDSERREREQHLANVKRDGRLEWVPVRYRADREIVLAAVQQDPYALRYAAEELQQDGTFAPEAKQRWNILKVSMLSGRST